MGAERSAAGSKAEMRGVGGGVRKSKRFKSYGSSCGGQILHSSHLSQGGFALEEVCVLAALRRVELGVEEGTAVGNGLQGGGTLVGEGKTHKQLQRREHTRLSGSIGWISTHTSQ